VTRRSSTGLAWGALLLALTAVATAQVFEPREFEDPERARRYQVLISELRCLVCQNQNLADSNAPLAADLRQLTYDMIREGKSDAEIIDFMVARYGDFVLYRPPIKPTTAILWGGPFLLLAIGIWLLLRYLGRRASARVEGTALSAEERARLERMLEAEGSETDPEQRD
jgi:cytochrome c-type biogenesis protein CcmH